jgi:hypothetical protein
MDEPKRTVAEESKYLIPAALAVLLLAYFWPEQDVQGPVETTYSRLLGFRIEGQPVPTRRVVGSIVMHLTWLAVALAVARPLARRGRTMVLGAAALLGLDELLLILSVLLFDQFLGVSTLLGLIGGGLLIAGTVVALREREATEIHAAEGGRA